MKLKPDAILFDMDGVLIDSLDSWWKSLNFAIKKCHGREITREEAIDALDRAQADIAFSMHWRER